jgi:hypothetical protein
MTRNIILILILTLAFYKVNGQDDEAYVKANAVCINNPENLSDSIYKLLSPFQVIMFGEMHGTNESALIVNGLTNLFTNKGENVQVGLEITSELMNKFLQLHTDTSIYQSEFFHNPPYQDGRESYPWANLISQLNNNPKVNIFFFDTNRESDVLPRRDSLMYVNIKKQYKQHPTWRMITLSGNYHSKTSYGNYMASYFKRDKELNISSKVCSINLEYKQGFARANFTHGLELKELGSYPSVYNSTLDCEKYLMLVSSKSYYEYTGLYYTKNITAAKMTSK